MNVFVPSSGDRKRVTGMVRAGIPFHLIARSLEIDEDTLNVHFKKELDLGKADAVYELASVLYGKALEGCDKSLALYLKTQGAKFGWQERQIVENVDSAETEALKATIAAMEAKAQSEY